MTAVDAGIFLPVCAAECSKTRKLMAIQNKPLFIVRDYFSVLECHYAKHAPEMEVGFQWIGNQRKNLLDGKYGRGIPIILKGAILAF